MDALWNSCWACQGAWQSLSCQVCTVRYVHYVQFVQSAHYPTSSPKPKHIYVYILYICTYEWIYCLLYCVLHTLMTKYWWFVKKYVPVHANTSVAAAKHATSVNKWNGQHKNKTYSLHAATNAAIFQFYITYRILHFWKGSEGSQFTAQHSNY